ncbi:MAG TPA: glycogen debranching enzyme N-terminal domain-containing protein, partial [Polyangiaceae bacterium]|nr:glycogen debranching enzyme N-terminal domain-containing protein [Polyangiaceae bacterium]
MSGVSTRRYHALLLVARHPPQDRIVLVNHLSEWLDTSQGPVFLSSARGHGPPEDGYRHCVGFVARPAAEWRYEVDGMTMTRTIVCARGRDAVVVRWQITGRHRKAVRLFVRPMLTVRPADAVVSATDAISSSFENDGGRVSWQPRSTFPRVFVWGARDYDHSPAWRRGVDYSIDRERGEPADEDWWSPGTLSVVVAPDAPAFLAFTTEDDVFVDAAASFERELDRRLASNKPARSTGSLGRLHDALIAGAESYIVEVDDRVAL